MKKKGICQAGRLAKNPEGHYLLKHDGILMAYFWLLPVKHERLMAFINGEIRGGDITAEDVETFEPGRPVGCLLVGIASEPDAGAITRMHYVHFLLRGVKRETEFSNTVSDTLFIASMQTAMLYLPTDSYIAF
jgi:hypothetical protein